MYLAFVFRRRTRNILVSRAWKQVPRKRKLLAIVGIRIVRWEVSGRRLVVRCVAGRQLGEFEKPYLESCLGLVPLGSASMVTSTLTPGFRATGLPSSSVKVFWTRISRYKSSAP